MAYLLLYVFIGVIIVGTATAVQVYRELKSSHATLGTVAEVIPTRSVGGDDNSFHYAIAYEIDDIAYVHTTPWSSNPPAYWVGERVWIAYHPRRPHDGRIATMAGSYGGASIMLLIGTFGTLVCLGLIFSQPLMRRLHPHLYA